MSRPSHLWISSNRFHFVDLVEVVSFGRWRRGEGDSAKVYTEVTLRSGRQIELFDSYGKELYEALIAYLDAEMAAAVSSPSST